MENQADTYYRNQLAEKVFLALVATAKSDADLDNAAIGTWGLVDSFIAHGKQPQPKREPNEPTPRQ